MKRTFIFILISISSCIFSCGDKTENPTTNNPTASDDSPMLNPDKCDAVEVRFDGTLSRIDYFSGETLDSQWYFNEDTVFQVAHHNGYNSEYQETTYWFKSSPGKFTKSMVWRDKHGRTTRSKSINIFGHVTSDVVHSYRCVE